MQESYAARQPESDRTHDGSAQKPPRAQEPLQRAIDPSRLAFYDQLLGHRPPAGIRLSPELLAPTGQPIQHRVEEAIQQEPTSTEEEEVQQHEPVAAKEVLSLMPRREALRAQLLGNGVPPHLRLSSLPPIQQVQQPLLEPVEPLQRKENTTGLPDPLKAGIESLSGLSLDDVQVHYHSSKPAEVQALAYTQGAQIHVGLGQEQHLPHEAWHVVQQKQGRVQPTLQAKGMKINDDLRLEREADVMGEKGLARTDEGAGGAGYYREAQLVPHKKQQALQSSPLIIQRKIVRVTRGDLPPDGTVYCTTIDGLRYYLYHDGSIIPIEPNESLDLDARVLYLVWSDGTTDYYDDEVQKKSAIDQMEAVRNTVRDFKREIDTYREKNEILADPQESGTELIKQFGTTEDYEFSRKIHKVDNLLDMVKASEMLREKFNTHVGVRMGGSGAVFVIERKGNDSIYLTTTNGNWKLKQKLTENEGKGATKKEAGESYTGIGEWLSKLPEDQTPLVGQAIYEKYATGKPYGEEFQAVATILDYLAALLLIVEPVRTPYAYALGIASLKAIANGISIENVLYKGSKRGYQDQALHPGTASWSNSRVSGQVMEQNLGANVTPSGSKSMSSKTFSEGAIRNLLLFKIAAGERSMEQMFDEDFVQVVKNQMNDEADNIAGMYAIDAYKEQQENIGKEKALDPQAFNAPMDDWKDEAFPPNKRKREEQPDSENREPPKFVLHPVQDASEWAAEPEWIWEMVDVAHSQRIKEGYVRVDNGYALSPNQQIQLRMLKRENVNIVPDGDCLFNSLIEVGAFREGGAQEFRNMVADKVENGVQAGTIPLGNFLEQQDSQNQDLQVTRAIEQIRQMGSYNNQVGDNMPTLIATALNITIVIINKQGINTIINDGAPNGLYFVIRFTEPGAHYHATRLTTAPHK